MAACIPPFHPVLSLSLSLSLLLSATPPAGKEEEEGSALRAHPRPFPGPATRRGRRALPGQVDRQTAAGPVSLCSLPPWSGVGAQSRAASSAPRPDPALLQAPSSPPEWARCGLCGETGTGPHVPLLPHPCPPWPWPWRDAGAQCCGTGPGRGQCRPDRRGPGAETGDSYGSTANASEATPPRPPLPGSGLSLLSI